MEANLYIFLRITFEQERYRVCIYDSEFILHLLITGIYHVSKKNKIHVQGPILHKFFQYRPPPLLGAKSHIKHQQSTASRTEDASPFPANISALFNQTPSQRSREALDHPPKRTVQPHTQRKPTLHLFLRMTSRIYTWMQQILLFMMQKFSLHSLSTIQ